MRVVPATGHRVGHQKNVARTLLGPQRDGDRDRVDMNAIGDEPGMERAILQRVADHAGRAMLKRAHGVEQMRDERGTARRRVPRHGVGGVGMAEADADTGLREAADLRAGHAFGGDCGEQ